MYELKKCPCCNKWSYTVEMRARNTQYVDDESNYLTSCAVCYGDDCEYYAERWAEYYSGLL